MIFNITFDSSVGSAPTGFASTVNAVAQFFQNTYSDNVTVNINVGYGEVDGQSVTALGESSTFLNTYTYTQVRSALLSDAKTANDSAASNTLPATSPLGGATYWVAHAEAKALGLLPANAGADGSVGFSSSANIFDYDRSDGISAGRYDFYAVVAHEFSEVMGRQLMVGQTFGGHANSLEPLDLFHYASAGARAFTGAQAGYFSLDGGSTNLDNFNTNTGGDFGDWAATAGNDAFLAFGSPGVVNAITEADLSLMDVIGWDRTSPPPPPPPPSPTIALAHSSPNDFNGDAFSDFLWQNVDGTPAEWQLVGAHLIAGGNVGFNPGPSWHEKAAGDLDGDGKADILWQNADGTPAVWLMNGLSVVSATNVGFNPGSSWHVISAADFNGDGKPDILWQNADGTPAIWLMNGTSLISGASLFNPGPSWHVIGASDFDGDGKADILWQNSSGQAAIWLMNGQSLISGSNVGPNPGSSWQVQSAGDFNGDGRADILWQNTDGTPAVWLMNGQSVLSSSNVGFNPGAAWQIHTAADFNGDGKADIEWQNTDGTPAVWLMDGFNLVLGSNIGFDPGPSWHLIPEHHILA